MINMNLGFKWWRVFGILSLIFGPLSTLGFAEDLGWPLSFSISIFIILISLQIFKFNKYAMLFMTILSLNPFIWWGNGLYLKHRWNHPKANGISQNQK